MQIVMKVKSSFSPSSVTRWLSWTVLLAVFATTLLVCADPADAARKKKDKKKAGEAEEDPYAEYVWPPPPNEARIKLEEIITGRADVEGTSKLRKALIGASPETPFDRLSKPFAVAYDPQGRILVTDWASAALLRFDRQEGRLDVFGTRGTARLQQPLGLHAAADGTVFVADAGLKRVVRFAEDGSLLGMYGDGFDLQNPTDSVLSQDGKTLYVVDSKAHRVATYDIETGAATGSFGGNGGDEGEMHFPTSLALDGDGNLLVVDQLNARVQLFAPDGEYLDHFGGRGVGFGNFSRPKDIAVDAAGFIYVTDNAFNNVQLFDADFTLLTFIGSGGSGPGNFWGASGIAVRGDEFAVVDQVGKRVQIFKYIVPRNLTEPTPEQPAGPQ